MSANTLLGSNRQGDGSQTNFLVSEISVEDWVWASRREQGLDAKVGDPSTLFRIQRFAHKATETSDKAA